MPRSRRTEMPARQSPRGQLQQLRTLPSPNLDPMHHGHVTNRSPRLGDRHGSPRRVELHPDPLDQKKLGTCIADLESQLEQAQEELKILKEQLAAAQAAKKEFQEETVSIEHNVELVQPTDDQEAAPILEPEEPSLEDLASKHDEINLLKACLEEKENKLELSCQENESLKKKLAEADSEISSIQTVENEMVLKLGQMREELEASEANAAHLDEKVECVERAKEALEAEMKTLRVQTDQWRKAADAAASVLAEGVGVVNGRRISDRRSSLDKHFGGLFDAPAGSYAGFLGSPGVADDDLVAGFGGGKRKGGGGIRMLGELWKKKGQK